MLTAVKMTQTSAQPYNRTSLKGSSWQLSLLLPRASQRTLFHPRKLEGKLQWLQSWDKMTLLNPWSMGNADGLRGFFLKSPPQCDGLKGRDHLFLLPAASPFFRHSAYTLGVRPPTCPVFGPGKLQERFHVKRPSVPLSYFQVSLG